MEYPPLNGVSAGKGYSGNCFSGVVDAGADKEKIEALEELECAESIASAIEGCGVRELERDGGKGVHSW